MNDLYTTNVKLANDLHALATEIERGEYEGGAAGLVQAAERLLQEAADNEIAAAHLLRDCGYSGNRCVRRGMKLRAHERLVHRLHEAIADGIL